MATKFHHDAAMHYLGHHKAELSVEEKDSLARLANTFIGPSRYADFSDYETFKLVHERIGRSCEHKQEPPSAGLHRTQGLK